MQRIANILETECCLKSLELGPYLKIDKKVFQSFKHSNEIDFFVSKTSCQQRKWMLTLQALSIANKTNLI